MKRRIDCLKVRENPLLISALESGEHFNSKTYRGVNVAMFVYCEIESSVNTFYVDEISCYWRKFQHG